MSEPYTIVLRHSAVFDGTTPITGKISEFTTSNRTYTRDLDAGGVVPADFWGLFSPDSPKIVGVSAQTRNPFAIARVTNGNFDSFREEVDLRPLVQHVIMYPNDQLALQTIDRGVPIELLVQPLSESDHVGWAKRYDPLERTRRFRIIRGDNLGWAPPVNAPVLTLGWAYDALTGLNVATTTQQGVFDLKTFFGPRVVEGVDVWVRVSGAQNVNVGFQEGSQNGDTYYYHTGLPKALWSDRMHVGFDDRIKVSSDAPGANAVAIIDIEFAPPDHRKCRCAPLSQI